MTLRSMPPRIDLPRRAVDVPPLVGLLGLAMVSFGLGVLLSRVSMDRNRVLEDAAGTPESLAFEAGIRAAMEEAEPNEGGPVEPGGERAAPAIRAETPNEGPSAQSEAPGRGEEVTAGSGEAAGEESIEEEPITSSEEPARGEGEGEEEQRDIRVRKGRVAYLRCDGARLREGPIPCPRDRELEGTVWAAIDALPECRALHRLDPAPNGRADIWLHFQDRRYVELTIRENADDQEVDAALLQCFAEALRGLETTVRGQRLLVSFRFLFE